MANATRSTRTAHRLLSMGGSSPKVYSLDDGTRGIRNVSVITTGEALGHGEWIDRKFAESVVEHGNAHSVGIKSRFGHPGACSDAIGTELGRFTTFRIVERQDLSEAAGYEVLQVLADFKALPPTKKNSAALDHIFKLAQWDAQMIGTSIVFYTADDGEFEIDENGEWVVDNPSGYPHVRLAKLTAVDFVSDPAANPEGLYSAESAESLLDELLRVASGNTRLRSGLEYILSATATSAKKKATPYPSAMSKPTKAKPAAKLGERLSKSFKAALARVFSLRGFADATTADGVVVRFPGELPVVGDTIVVVNEDGTDGDFAPDGVHELPDLAVTITVEDGVITDVVPVEAEEPETAPEGGEGEGLAATNPGQLSAERAAAQAELAAERQRNDVLEKQAAMYKQRATALATQPAAGNGFESRKAGYDRLGFNVARSGALGDKYSEGELGEAISLLRQLNGKNPDGLKLKRQSTRKSGRAYAGETGAEIGTVVLDRMKEYLDELFEQDVLFERVQDEFTITEQPVVGDGTLRVGLPTLDDTTSGQYLKPGQVCDPVPDGETVISARFLEILPWHYTRNYCPRERGWANLMNGRFSINDTEIPFQAIIIEQIERQIVAEWERTIWFGDTTPVTGNGAAFQGILPLLLADTGFVGGPTDVAMTAANFNLATATATANPETEVDALIDAMPAEMRQRAEVEQLRIYCPHRQFDAWKRYRFRTYNAQVERAMDARDRFVYDVVDNAVFVPYWAFESTQPIGPAGVNNWLLTFQSNLHLGLSSLQQNLRLTVDIPDRVAGILKVLVDGHTGTNYARNDRFVLGRNS